MRAHGQARARRAGRALARSAAIALLILAVAPLGVARAEAPKLTITSPQNGSVSNDQTPLFRGTTNDSGSELEVEFFDPVRVKIYAGPIVSGEPVQKLETGAFPPHSWVVGPAKTLPPGEYTAHAEQENELLHQTGFSPLVTFTIDTTPPIVTITSPPNGSSTRGESQAFAGTAGTAEGDERAVTVELYAGSSIGAQAPLVSATVQAPGGSWSTVLGGLGPGIYTAQATQRDQARNVGRSAPVTFTLIAPVSGRVTSPPAASFRWFPAAPSVGQSVALVSSSTDAGSPIAGYAWDLAGNGPFKAAGSVLMTSFASPGAHVVRLRVTDARGLSSVAVETIPVAPPTLTLMQPFPIVRIAGIETSAGVNVSLLSVQSPVGARVTVTCRGRGCKTRSQSRVAYASRRNARARTVVLAFRRFQRSLRAGAILEIRVYKPGEIGKFTRFVIRRHRLPVRLDACLGSDDPKPIACPG